MRLQMVADLTEGAPTMDTPSLPGFTDKPTNMMLGSAEPRPKSGSMEEELHRISIVPRLPSR